jgi:hypothetical protein
MRVLWMAHRAHLWLVDALPTPGARLRAVARDLGDLHLPRHDPHHGQALGVKFDRLKLLKHPLKEKWVRDNSPRTQTKSCHESIVYPEPMARAF